MALLCFFSWPVECEPSRPDLKCFGFFQGSFGGNHPYFLFIIFIPTHPSPYTRLPVRFEPMTSMVLVLLSFHFYRKLKFELHLYIYQWMTLSFLVRHILPKSEVNSLCVLFHMFSNLNAISYVCYQGMFGAKMGIKMIITWTLSYTYFLRNKQSLSL